MVQATATATKDKWSAAQYNTHASFVYSQAYAAPVLDLLNAQPGEKIYDFGCGSGDLSIQIAKRVGETGSVVGVDFSDSMVRNKFTVGKATFSDSWISFGRPQVTKARNNGLKYAFQSDAQDVQFPEDFPEELKTGFDGVFSNAALHWCKRNPKGVFESAKRVLKQGGRFVVDTGGFMACTGMLSKQFHPIRMLMSLSL